MSDKHILFDVRDEIATITLNRPEARNALSPEMREGFEKAFAEIKARAGNDIKAVIVTGAGGAFCAGGDVKSMGDRAQTIEVNRKHMRGGHSRMYDLMHMELPVISLVDGAAAGAGCNIALSADFVLATPRAFFAQSFARIGLVPDWGGFFILPRLVGLQRAKELVFTARRVYAEEAKELGLVYGIVGQETAMEEARAFAARFRNAPTTAIGIAKTVLNQSLNTDHRTLLELEALGQWACRDTDFHKEAVRRFAAKETPLYDWEAMDKKKS